MSLPPPFIVTLHLDQPTFDTFDTLRREHFPPARNIVPAHITLFHALLGEQEQVIRDTLQEQCSSAAPITLIFSSVRFLGRGVAIEVDSGGLRQLRAQLASAWGAWLTPQDRQPYRPHMTIQNKVSAEVARALYNDLSSSWQPLTGRGEGLTLWRYLNGPWERVAQFPFQDEH